jgi:hypothetical protein
MESLDLTIENYQLPDLLALFNLPVVFNDVDLKRAKMMVLKTHPDKSRLPKEYFLFFTKAYRIIHQIYTIRNPSTREHYTQHVNNIHSTQAVPSMRCVEKDTYIPIDENMAAKAGAKIVDYGRVIRKEGYIADQTDDYEVKSQLMIKKRLDEMMGNSEISRTSDSKENKLREFNTWFNQKFDQYKLKDEEQEGGYDEWFRGMDDKNAADTGADAANAVDDQEINEATTWQEKVDLLNKRKQDLRNKYAVIERKDIEHAVYSNGGGINGNSYDLTRERPQEYSSEGLFGNLRYEDLKKAHTETVIPVTDEDYHNAKKFRNVNELQTFRDLSRREFRINEAEQQHTYDKTRLLQEEEDTRRAFILAKQAEISRDIHKKLYSDMFRLE